MYFLGTFRALGSGYTRKKKSLFASKISLLEKKIQLRTLTFCRKSLAASDVQW